MPLDSKQSEAPQGNRETEPTDPNLLHYSLPGNCACSTGAMILSEVGLGSFLLQLQGGMPRS
jgi:hypothetical protein